MWALREPVHPQEGLQIKQRLSDGHTLTAVQLLLVSVLRSPSRVMIAASKRGVPSS